jgi:hypothetical protein
LWAAPKSMPQQSVITSTVAASPSGRECRCRSTHTGLAIAGSDAKVAHVRHRVFTRPVLSCSTEILRSPHRLGLHMMEQWRAADLPPRRPGGTTAPAAAAVGRPPRPEPLALGTIWWPQISGGGDLVAVGGRSGWGWMCWWT